MPDFPRDSSQHDRGDDADKQWTPTPAETTGRRRRSLDDSGGTRVSDLLAKHGPASKKFRPVRRAEPERPQSGPAHDAAPEPPRRTGRRRAAPEPPPPPAAPPPLARPAAPPPAAAQPPIDPPSVPRVQLPRRAKPEPPTPPQPPLPPTSTSRRSVEQPSRRSVERRAERNAERSAHSSLDQPGRRSAERQAQRGIEPLPSRSVEPPSRRSIDPPSSRSVEPPSSRGIEPPSRRSSSRQARREVERPSLRDMAPLRDADAPAHPPRSAVDTPSRPGMPLPFRSNGTARPARPQPNAGESQPKIGRRRPPEQNAPADGTGTRLPRRGGRPEAPSRQRPSAGPPTEVLAPNAVDALRAASPGPTTGRSRRMPPVAPPSPPLGLAEQLNPRSPLIGRPRPPQAPPPTAHEVTQEIPAIRVSSPIAAGLAGPPETCEVRPRRADDEVEEAPPDERVKAIDATLARFTAVHDELAFEEAERARTSMFSWVRRIFGREDPEAEAAADGDEAADPAAEPPRATRLGDKKRERGRLTITSKTLAVIAAVMVLIGAGFAWNSTRGSSTQIRQVAALDPNSAAIQDRNKQKGDENFLIIGTAASPGGSGSSDGSATGVDAIMIAHIPVDRSRATMLSFPTDLEIQRPACEHWDPSSGQYSDAAAGQDHVPLNSAFSVGGPKCVTKAIQQLSGLAVNHFVGMDFSGLKSSVDALHGVEVCFAQPMKDDQLGMIVPGSGRTTLNGDQALNYVRARHVSGAKNSDYAQIKRQQRFVASFLRTAMAPQVMASATKLRGLVQSFTTTVFGDNIGADSMLPLAQSLHSLNPSHITFLTVPTAGAANQAGNQVLKTDDANTLFQAIIKGGALPGDVTPLPSGNDPAPEAQPTPPGVPSTVVDPHLIKVQVLNTTGRGRLAGQIGDKLSAIGYPVIRLQDSTEHIDKTLIRYAPQRADYANTLATSVPGASMQVDPSLGGAVELFLGPGFKGEVVTPSAGTDAQSDAGNGTGDLPTTNGADTTCDNV